MRVKRELRWTVDHASVHVVVDPLPQPETLSHAERKRARRFVHAVDRRRYVARRSELRRALGAVTGSNPETLDIRSDTRGKPFVTDRSAWFSLSSVDNVVAVAISRTGDVGVDIVRCSSGMYDEQTARVVMHPNELEAIRNSVDPDLAFARLWARNEAVAKLDGTGLDDHTKDIDLSDGAHHPKATITDLEGPGGLVIAVAVANLSG